MTQTFEISIDYWNDKPTFGWYKTANAAGTTFRPINLDRALALFQYLAQWKNSEIRTVHMRCCGYTAETCTVEMG